MTTYKNSTGLRISILLAFIGGILTPVLETIRRWHQIAEPRYFMAWFDDYIIGALLLMGAYIAYKKRQTGWLAVAWGFATGLAFFSFFNQLQNAGFIDPAPVSGEIVIAVKGIMLSICIVCMIITASVKSKG